jgi:prepilin-type N-terminal cleavage/methylation domain-containing protein
MSKQASNGFTLSELLISLSVLALISALTLPSIYTTVENHRKKVVFRETLGSVQEVLRAQWMEGKLDSSNLDFPILFDNFNSAKKCTNNTAVDCRFLIGNTELSIIASEDKFILHNGALVCPTFFWSTAPTGTKYALVFIDWNGSTKGPNAFGDDIIYGFFNTGQGLTASWFNAYQLYDRPLQPGELRIPDSSSAGIFNSIRKLIYGGI